MYVASDGEMLCDTLLQCFVATTTAGWRAGGGMGDVFGDSVTAERSGINAYAGAALFFMFFWCGGNTRKHAHHTHTQKHRLTHTRPFPAPAGLGLHDRYAPTQRRAILNVLFLNVIFGIIVDTFGLLREQVCP